MSGDQGTKMVRGLLDGLNDPEIMAQIAEKQRMAERVAEQMGVTVQEARHALARFAADLSPDGHELH